jgi:antitoxin VapB
MRGTKLFRHGRSQAVQLPPEYRFEGSEVHIRRAPSSGDVVLSRRPESWEEFFELLKTIDVPQDFLPDRDDARERKNAVCSDADPISSESVAASDPLLSLVEPVVIQNKSRQLLLTTGDHVELARSD